MLINVLSFIKVIVKTLSVVENENFKIDFQKETIIIYSNKQAFRFALKLENENIDLHQLYIDNDFILLIINKIISISNYYYLLNLLEIFDLMEGNITLDDEEINKIGTMIKKLNTAEKMFITRKNNILSTKVKEEFRNQTSSNFNFILNIRPEFNINRQSYYKLVIAMFNKLTGRKLKLKNKNDSSILNYYSDKTQIIETKKEHFVEIDGNNIMIDSYPIEWFIFIEDRLPEIKKISYNPKLSSENFFKNIYLLNTYNQEFSILTTIFKNIVDSEKIFNFNDDEIKELINYIYLNLSNINYIDWQQYLNNLTSKRKCKIYNFQSIKKLI